MKQSYRRWGFLVSALVHLALGGGVAWLLLGREPAVPGEKVVPVSLAMFAPPALPGPVPQAAPSPPEQRLPPEPEPELVARAEPPPPPPAPPVKKPAPPVIAKLEPRPPKERRPTHRPKQPTVAPLREPAPTPAPPVARQVAPKSPAAPVAAVAPPPARAVERIWAAYLARLQAAIERYKYYPRLSRRRGEQGKVLVELVIGRDGRFRTLRMQSSSGHRRLDEAAMQTLRRVGGVGPLPDELGLDDWHITVPLVYSLRR